MAKPHPGHIVEWISRCRDNMKALQTEMPHLTKEERLSRLHAQYSVIANLGRVCSGNSYFKGAPRIKKS